MFYKHFLLVIVILTSQRFCRLPQTAQMWIFFFLRIWLSHERKKSCYLFLILVDVNFTLSIIVLTQGRNKEARNLGNWETQKLLKVMWKFSRKLQHVGICMKMYRSLWNIPCSFVGIVGAKMRKVLKEEKWSWRVIENLLLILVASRKVNNPMLKIKAFNIWKVWSMTLCCLPNSCLFKWLAVNLTRF